MQIIRLDQIGSTNTYVAEHHSELLSDTVIVTDNQTAGRGQRGNSWEAEPGKNLTFTILVRPTDFRAIRQFSLSEATAVAIVDVINEELGVETKIKWPNDIYHNDSKLAGILIEHAVMGSNIMHTIIGVGLNVNQSRFLSDAPNPVSLFQILGHEVDRNDLLEKICRRICEKIAALSTQNAMDDLHNDYMQRLWRNDKRCHPFRDLIAGDTYYGSIVDIEPTGHLNIREAIDKECGQAAASDSPIRRYAFKEVEWII